MQTSCISGDTQAAHEHHGGALPWHQGGFHPSLLVTPSDFTIFVTEFILLADILHFLWHSGGTRTSLWNSSLASKRISSQFTCDTKRSHDHRYGVHFVYRYLAFLVALRRHMNIIAEPIPDFFLLWSEQQLKALRM